jgi:hypothetical protein
MRTPLNIAEDRHQFDAGADCANSLTDCGESVPTPNIDASILSAKA